MMPLTSYRDIMTATRGLASTVTTVLRRARIQGWCICCKCVLSLDLVAHRLRIHGA
ncbi:hypothetical protein BD414DRAFT_489099 [Trametes punicea]|nr:hypothetical protein BD414DRAFT_489099 [Trametes punicea]